MRRRISFLAAMVVVLGGLPHGLRADDLRVALPDDVKFVVRVDLPAIQKSTVAGRLLAKAKAEILGKMADNGSEGDGKGKDLSLDKIVEMLGFDPFEEVQSVVVAAADYESPEQSLVGCIQLGKTTGNLEGLLLALPHYSVEEHGEHQIHAATPEEGKQVFGAFFTAADGNRTVLIAAKREAVVQLLDSLDGNGPSEGLKAVTLRGEDSPLAALDVFELPDEMTAEEGPPANIAKILRSLSVRVDEADGNVNIQTTLVADADKQAEQLEQAARGLSAMVDLAASSKSEEEDKDLQQVQRFLRDVVIERSGSSLQLSLSVPADEVQKLIDDNLFDK